MIRQLVVAIALGLGLSACGVGAGEDLSTVDVRLADEGAVATSQDPVPPAPEPPSYEFATDRVGNIVIVAVASPSPPSPGDENASSQDPIPPKVQGPRLMHQFH
ncbi:MAG TPA: hypothetical protein VGK67_02335 [Myxococcales bacterium]|jgi:hypothetical protein